MPTLRLKLLSLILLAAVLQACASAPAPSPTPSPAPAPPPPAAQNLFAETDDLRMVSDIALQLADRYGRERVLVVFDIDNTLLAMEQGLGSDQWYYWQKELAGEAPCSEQLVQDRFMAQGALYFASATRPTQLDAAEQVRRIQDAGLKVIALTSRGTDYQLQTFRELRRNNISFWPSALPPARGYPDVFIPEGGTRDALYQDGVFMTAGQHKGTMLKALLDKTGTSAPTIIIMVDDKAENLQAVMETFEETPTAIHAWRYSGEDANVAALDKQNATERWNTVKPALITLEQVFGPDNFDLPEDAVREGCQ